MLVFRGGYVSTLSNFRFAKFFTFQTEQNQSSSPKKLNNLFDTFRGSRCHNFLKNGEVFWLMLMMMIMIFYLEKAGS